MIMINLVYIWFSGSDYNVKYCRVYNEDDFFTKINFKTTFLEAVTVKGK